MAKSSKVKPASRRDELRRNLARQPLGLRALLQRPEVLGAGLLLLAVIVVVSAVVAWSRDQIFVAAGQVMTDTRVSRLDFTLPDETLTEERRLEERERSPEVYALEESYFGGTIPAGAPTPDYEGDCRRPEHITG